MLNRLWPLLLILAVVGGAINGQLADVSDALLACGKDAISLGITLAGTMCVWNGLTAIAEQAGITRMIARLLRPLLRILFPRITPDGQAARAIAMSMTANLLGLGNAATPLGLRAMEALTDTMPDARTASNEMVTFVVMNTASLQLFPTTVIALRQSVGSPHPTLILPAVWVASLLTLGCALLASYLFRSPTKKVVTAP